ncbi:phosphopantetheine-binding protein [Micromonospora sp. DT233]|uniref:phosphopantetheine-binding protein n=1 Tax=Micromonospora sp. DT233 TaxID=3393432 RepID=UPI003CF327D5
MDDDQVFELVRKNLCVVLPEVDPASVRPDMAMADLGCNSIDRTEVVAMTMEDLDVDVPVMEFRDVCDIRTLVAVLRRHT